MCRWIRQLRSFTSLPILIMHANVPSPERLMNATALRLQLHRVSLLVVEPPGTLPWYREQYTKLHAWSLPCRQVAYLDYDGFAVRNMDSIFDECGTSPLCAVADTMTPINPKYRGKYFNGGVLVLRPNNGTYEQLLREAEADAKAKRARWFAEQGFLNQRYRGQVKLLPNGYNVMGASLERGLKQEQWRRMHPERDFFVHEKVYKLGAQQRRALGLGLEEAFAGLHDSRGRLIRDDPATAEKGAWRAWC